MVSSVYTETPTMFFVFVGVWFLFISSNFVARIVGFAFLGVASLLRIDVLLLNIVASITYLVLFRRKAFDTRAAPLGLVLLCAFPISMLAYQYYSTQEIGLVKPEFRQSGYYAWMRSWFAIEKIEYDRLCIRRRYSRIGRVSTSLIIPRAHSIPPPRGIEWLSSWQPGALPDIPTPSIKAFNNLDLENSSSIPCAALFSFLCCA